MNIKEEKYRHSTWFVRTFSDICQVSKIEAQNTNIFTRHSHVLPSMLFSNDSWKKKTGRRRTTDLRPSSDCLDAFSVSIVRENSLTKGG